MAGAGLARLRVGGVPEHFNMPWHEAIATGATGPFVLDWQDYPSGTGAMLAALAGSELDLAILLTEGAALGLARDLPVEPLSLYTESPLIWGVHVAPRSRFDGIAALGDARFAVSRMGSGSHLMSLALALEQGWPADRQSFVVVGDMAGAIDALGRGRADAFLWEHFTTEPAVEAGHFRRIGDFVSPWPAWVVCASHACRAREGDRLLELVGAIADAAGRLAREPAAAALIGARYGLREDAVARWLERTRWVDRPTAPEPALAAATSMLRTAGAI